jgi:flagellar assembly factor FliW
VTTVPDIAPAPVDLDLPLLTFASGLPGFSQARRFALVRLDEVGLLFSLRSLDEPGLRFLVVPPGQFFTDYAPHLTDATVTELDLGSPQEALVLVVVTPGETPRDATVNLLAPIVVNQRTREAAQVVLDRPDLPLRAALVLN